MGVINKDNIERLEGFTYLVKRKNFAGLRLATFNGFGKGRGGTDWQGDTGGEYDMWMDTEVEWFFPEEKLEFFMSLILK